MKSSAPQSIKPNLNGTSKVSKHISEEGIKANKETQEEYIKKMVFCCFYNEVPRFAPLIFLIISIPQCYYFYRRTDNKLSEEDHEETVQISCKWNNIKLVINVLKL